MEQSVQTVDEIVTRLANQGPLTATETAELAFREGDPEGRTSLPAKILVLKWLEVLAARAIGGETKLFAEAFERNRTGFNLDYGLRNSARAMGDLINGMNHGAGAYYWIEQSLPFRAALEAESTSSQQAAGRFISLAEMIQLFDMYASLVQIIRNLERYEAVRGKSIIEWDYKFDKGYVDFMDKERAENNQ